MEYARSRRRIRFRDVSADDMSLIRNPILEALPRSFSYIPHVTTEDAEAGNALPSEVQR